jgi:uncharacterized repeat protein (TIGR03803 family)
MRLFYLRFTTLLSLTAIIAATMSLFQVSNASAAAFKTLHAFCTQSGCPDGGGPWAGLLMDQSGNLYGTTTEGGTHADGVVFQLVPNGASYTENVLYNFCALANCADGQAPYAGLIMDVDGNLYGTTAFGGTHGHGVVFELTHGSNGWSLGVIHSFCSVSKCADGSRPYTGLSYFGQNSGVAWDKFSPLFGTTQQGGANGNGVAYQLLEDGSLWNYEILHSYRSNGASESAYPGPLLVDSSENLFGVTGYGGKYGSGVLYKLAGGTWKETTLHNFCAKANCTDGGVGSGPLAMDAAGNLFGTTQYSNCMHGKLCGVVFERTAGGGYSVIHNFCPLCGGGLFPTGLIIDAAGNLYGTTEDSGKGENGNAFRLSYDSGQQRWIATVLHTFCPGDGECKNGDAPEVPPILDSEGNLYGTTSGENSGGEGTVFELTP